MHQNTQIPLPNAQLGDRIIVHSIWPTIQGEGPFAGRMAIFIRLWGCNLQCPFCDTDYTSTATPYLLTEFDKISKQLRAITPIRPAWAMATKQLVVITGGEPFRQNLAPLVDHLILDGYQVQIETNGTLYQSLHRNAVIVCSPKTPKIHPELAARADCYKYVLDADHIDPNDGLPAGTLGKFNKTARPPEGWTGDVFVQPLDEQDEAKNKLNLEACVRSVLRFGYRLCIQTHKLANVP